MSAAEDRAAYIKGLRIYADTLEKNPDLPTTFMGASADSPVLTYFGGDDAREQMASVARAFPCNWGKGTSDNGKWFELSAALGGGLHIKLYAVREAVCTRRVVGTEEQEVEEEVTPAVTRKVVKQVEVVEWDCGPVLGKALDEASGPMRDQS